jgi:hypothetical protein
VTSEQAAGQTGTGWFDYIGRLVYDVVPRIIAGLGAVIIIGLGIWLIGSSRKEA